MALIIFGFLYILSGVSTVAVWERFNLFPLNYDDTAVEEYILIGFIWPVFIIVGFFALVYLLIRDGFD